MLSDKALAIASNMQCFCTVAVHVHLIHQSKKQPLPYDEM